MTSFPFKKCFSWQTSFEKTIYTCFAPLYIIEDTSSIAYTSHICVTAVARLHHNSVTLHAPCPSLPCYNRAGRASAFTYRKENSAPGEFISSRLLGRRAVSLCSLRASS